MQVSLDNSINRITLGDPKILRIHKYHLLTRGRCLDHQAKLQIIPVSTRNYESNYHIKIKRKIIYIDIVMEDEDSLGIKEIKNRVKFREEDRERGFIKCCWLISMNDL
jgi:hypothetical protein